MGEVSARHVARRPSRSVLVVVVAAACFGCAAGRVREVSPNEIPDLERRLSEDPNNGPVLLRYAAALFSAGQCDYGKGISQILGNTLDFHK